MAHAGGTDSSANSGAAAKPYRLAAPSKPCRFAAPFSAKPTPAQSTQVAHPSIAGTYGAWDPDNTTHRLLEHLPALKV